MTRTSFHIINLTVQTKIFVSEDSTNDPYTKSDIQTYQYQEGHASQCQFEISLQQKQESKLLSQFVSTSFSAGPQSCGMLKTKLD